MVRIVLFLSLLLCHSLGFAGLNGLTDAGIEGQELQGLWELVKEYFLYVFFAVLVFLLHSYYALRTRFLNAELQSEIDQKNRLLNKLQQLATMDELTGLPNRKLTFQIFRRELVRSRRMSSQLALLFIDLDDYKDVNERFGHSQGDEVLRELAREFNQLIRGNDLVGRIGGDKFLVVLGDVSGAEDARVVVKKLLEKINNVEINNEKQLVSANISALVFVADESNTIEGLLSSADDILKQSRDAGRGQYLLVNMTTSHVEIENSRA